MNFIVPSWLVWSLIGIVLLLAWCRAGLFAMRLYVYYVRPGLLPFWEFVFVMLCGPVVWFRVRHLHNHPPSAPSHTTPVRDEGALPAHLRNRIDTNEDK